MYSNPNVALDSQFQSCGMGRYKHVVRARSDVMALLYKHQTLRTSVDTYRPPNSGNLSYTWVRIDGTIPTSYKGASYNTPIRIWVVETYPVHPPICFVMPTAQMIVKPGHRHVGADTRIYLPYLHSWSPTNSNLIDLCNAMSSVFSSDPPLRMGSSGSRTGSSSSGTQRSHSSSFSSQSSNMSGNPAAGAAMPPTSTYGLPRNQPPSSSTSGRYVNSSASLPPSTMSTGNSSTTTSTSQSDDHPPLISTTLPIYNPASLPWANSNSQSAYGRSPAANGSFTSGSPMPPTSSGAMSGSMSAGSVSSGDPMGPPPTYESSVGGYGSAASGGESLASTASTYGHAVGGRGGREEPYENFNDMILASAISRVYDKQEAELKEQLEKLRALETQSMYELPRHFEGLETTKRQQQERLEQLDRDVAELSKGVEDAQRRESEGINVDEVVIAGHTYLEQRLRAHADDLAIADLLYQLDKALQNEHIAFDVYMKKVRSLTRQQFMHRALVRKIDVLRSKGAAGPQFNRR